MKTKGKSKIEWTGSTWNPVTGCSKISAGCLNCYAEKMHTRLHGMMPDVYPEEFSQITFHPERVTPGWIKKQGWKPGSMVFVGSMTDLFQNGIFFTWLKQIWDVMADHPDITFQLLTKRPGNMKNAVEQLPYLENIWLGVTCENQQAADKRIPILLDTPAAVRFVSVEPMLGTVDLNGHIYSIAPGLNEGIDWLTGNTSQESSIFGGNCFPWILRDDDTEKKEPRIHWVICGPETGPGARDCDPDWIRSIRDQCVESGTPFFLKKLDKFGNGIILDEWRKFPEVKR